MEGVDPDLDASEVLAAALEQMEGIISGSTYDGLNENHSLPKCPNKVQNGQQPTVNSLLKELKILIQHLMSNDANHNNVIQEVDEETKEFISTWLQNPQNYKLANNPSPYENFEQMQERIHRLQTERENLQLQVSVLSEQVEAQSEKINELEMLLDVKREQLENTEDMLQKELINRSNLETSKLDLMTDTSNLRVKLASVQRDKQDLEDRYKRMEKELIILRARLTEKEAELATLNSKLLRNAPDLRLRKTSEDMSISSIDDKEKRYDSSLPRSKGLDLSLLSPTKSDSSDGQLRERTSSHSSIASASALLETSRTPPSKRHYSTIPRHHGAEVLHQIHQQLQQHQQDIGSNSPSSVDVSISGNHGLSDSSNTLPATNHQNSTSFQNLNHPGLDNFRHTRSKASGVTFAQPEVVVSPRNSTDIPRSTLSLPHASQSNYIKPDVKEKSKGIKKIFGRWRKSGSHSETEEEFKRGGFRSTAGPRLGWSYDTKTTKDIDVPFSQWDTDTVVDWFHRMGLNMYLGECKNWVKNGEHLLKATVQDYEKELGIKNALHRKKLQLALQAVSTDKSPVVQAAGLLDYHLVIRWLDDIGLPQYKDLFFDARVDGRMLHYMTVEDLFNLKVSNQLHHISIRRGIQVLRENSFDPHSLKRRSLPDETKEMNSIDVVLWTNHRVMEWLRTVDLSEYAPNLRGSGVHGALMVYEPKFNADLLATLLNIPPSKTLLRRHLMTQFKMLVGADLLQGKRDCESQTGYSPISPSTKLKAVRRGQFTLRKKGKHDAIMEDFVCPMEDGIVEESIKKTIQRRNSDCVTDKIQETKSDDKTVKEIGAVSQEIDSLTSMLQDEKLMSSVTTTNV